MPAADPDRLAAGMTLLGLRLRALRREADVGLKDVGEAVGVTIAHLSDIERGQKVPSLQLVFALADYFGVLMVDLLCDYPFGSRTPPSRPGVSP